MGAREPLHAAVARLADPEREYDFRPADFERVRGMIYDLAGIRLGDNKQNMVYSRLSRRLRATHIDAFSAYLERLAGDPRFRDGEMQEFINALTTNLTSFYREAHHFPVLAEFLSALDAPARMWCAAASTGEEVYTIAMTMVEAAGGRDPGTLLATDIDTKVLDTARRGAYKLDAASPCGEERLRQFFLRGRGENEGWVRVRPELARIVRLERLNLLEASWPLLQDQAGRLDAVFCRNVMIYFDRATQREILRRIAAHMRPGAMLFVGHSENFTDCREIFALRGKTVYQRL
jgi:chemotaxis protein methyltransferase CheR